MLSFRPLAPALFALALVAAPQAVSAQNFSDTQRGDIEKIVREYLIKHPEVLEEAMNELSKRQAAAESEKHQANIAQNSDAIFNSPRGVQIGNKDGDVTFVEFFDYNCGYCKRAMSDMLDLMKADPKLKVVLKEFPVLSQGSVEAAQVGVAMRMQDPTGKKYLDFHQKLLGGRGAADKARAMAVAKEVGARHGEAGKGPRQCRSARDAGGEHEARRIARHERHAELRNRQAGRDRRGRRREPEGKDRHRPLWQGHLLRGKFTSRHCIEAGITAGLFVCAAFGAFQFIGRSSNKCAGTAIVPEHRPSRFVVGAGNANTVRRYR